MNTYSFQAVFPCDDSIHADLQYFDIVAKSEKEAEIKAREHFSKSIKITMIESRKDTSSPCPICNKPFKTCGHF
jgi:hypothetical protein